MDYRSCIPDPEISAYPFPPPFVNALPEVEDLGNLSASFTPTLNFSQCLKQKQNERNAKNNAPQVMEEEECGSASNHDDDDDEISETESCEGLDQVPGDVSNPTMILVPAFLDNEEHTNAWPPFKRKNPASRRNPAPSTKRACVDRSVIANSITPRKSPGDPKNYRIITLSNGLRAILIQSSSDCACPRTGKSSGRFGGNPLIDCLEDQKQMEKQKYLPINWPIPPVCMQKFEGSWEDLISLPDPNPDSKSEAEETTMFETHTGGSDTKGAGDCAKKICPPAMVAVVVNAGVCDDPNDCLGLAHFTEHMVHYGSKRFPQEDHYINFSLNHGYGFNAFTENHTTTYYGIMPDEKINRYMDMMSSMLESPTFVNDMTSREVNSVDAEFHLKRHFDVLRRWFLFQTALKSDHPLKKFGFGNEVTLLKSKSMIHRKLRELHTNYYNAGAMTLGIESSVLSLDEQQELVVKHFGNIPKGNRKTLKETTIPKALRSVPGDSYNRYYIMQGLSTFSDLWVSWPIPSDSFNEKDHKTLTMVCAMLEDVSEGSLSHYLAREGLVWLMLVPSPVDYTLMDNKYTRFIAMEILLTDKGAYSTNRILEAIYSYIEYLRNLPESTMKRLFNELKLDAQRQIKYGRPDPPPGQLKPRTDTAMELAKGLQYVNPEDLLQSPIKEWQKATYSHSENKKVLEGLKQSNMIVIQTIPRSIRLKNFAKNGKIYIAPYTDAEYCYGTGMPNFLSKPNSLKFEALKSNKFLEGVNDTLTCLGEINLQLIQMPTCDQNKVIKAIHLGNTEGNYLGSCILNFFSPTVTSSPRNYALSLLWIASTMLTLRPDYGKATRAGIKFYAVPYTQGLMMMASGFPEKLLDAVESLTDQLFSKPVTETEFTLAQSSLIALYDLLFANNKEYITQDLLHNMTCNPYSEVLLDAITHIKTTNYVDVNNFSTWFKEQASALVLVQGNLQPEETGKRIDAMLNRQNYYPRLSSISALIASPALASMSPLPPGEKRIRIKSDVGTTYTSSLYFFRAKSFYELRTKRQLGYDVHPYFPRPEPGKPILLGIGITATATKFTACELDKAIDEFMASYGKYLETISETEFAAVKAFRGQTNSLTVDHVAAWYQSHFGELFASNDKNRYHYLGMSKISIQLIGNETKSCPNCPVCGSIRGWKKGDSWNDLKFAEGNGGIDDCFVTNPKSVGK
ncbi:Sporozoite developmental protein [Orchesella cincta]|uniref:Sporozoite developmental protein n=1 Tax=Orchesella cincta TaxID=48709 RepID=A0A1D2MM52_ORCCI|nr:Sporozoite developmental protein [Orchesella cincta]